MTTKFKLVLAVLFCIVSSGFAQGNWELMLPPYPASNNLVSLYFIDSQTGWAVGEYGTIVKTIDGGDTWSLIEIPWLDYLLDVHFPSAAVGYAVGQNGRIIKSTDGGESWSELEVRYTNNLNRLLFRDENRGWIIGEKGLILYTDDGGLNFQQQVSNSPGDLKGIAFINDSSLCVVGTVLTVLISSDYGKSWQSYPASDGDFTDVFFKNDTLGWIGGIKGTYQQGIILETTDGGQSWNEILEESHNYVDDCGSGERSGTPKSFNYPVQQIYFKDIWRGLVLTGGRFQDSNTPFYTNNGGEHWESIVHGCNENRDQASRFCFLTNKKVINTCYGGEFRFSYDGGRTWDYPNYLQRTFRRIFIGNDGQLLAYKRYFIDDYYLFSGDFGKTWTNFTPQIFDSTGNQMKVELGSRFPGSFIDDGKTLRIVSQLYGQVFESKDFGLTWHIVHSGISDEPYLGKNVKFLTPDTLISYYLAEEKDATGNNASVLVFNKSFDAGLTIESNRFSNLWNDVTPPRGWDKQIFDSYFLDEHTFFLVGSDGNIIKTTDMGENWISINSGVTDDLLDIEFINQSVGFIAGKFGRILKTEDGGETWRKTDSGTQENIYSVAFKNENEGWAGTENGLRYTTDCGETWHGVPMRYNHGLIRYIEFDKSGNGYAYTPSPLNMWEEMGIDKDVIPKGYTFMLCMKNEGVFIEDENDKGMVPKILELYANYPNPFNPFTKIAYNLPAAGPVCLKIYNIQGQLVRTVVDETQKSGKHMVSWYGLSDKGEMVTSGVYVYRIESGSEVKTRKMLLLR